MEALIIKGRVLINDDADITKVKNIFAAHKIEAHKGGHSVFNRATFYNVVRDIFEEFDDFDPMLLLAELNELPKGTFVSGEIDFSGYDKSTLMDSRFRMYYVSDGSKWIYQDAVESYPVVSSHSERLEFIGRFIDIMEDFLEEKEIQLPNDEKDGDDDAAIIYGSDYDTLSSKIEDLLIGYKVLDAEKEESLK